MNLLTALAGLVGVLDGPAKFGMPDGTTHLDMVDHQNARCYVCGFMYGCHDDMWECPTDPTRLEVHRQHLQERPSYYIGEDR